MEGKLFCFLFLLILFFVTAFDLYIWIDKDIFTDNNDVVDQESNTTTKSDDGVTNTANDNKKKENVSYIKTWVSFAILKIFFLNVVLSAYVAANLSKLCRRDQVSIYPSNF